MLFARNTRQFDAVVCRDCGISTFRKFQAHNLAFGWWGLISFVTNFASLARNATNGRTVKALPEPQGAPHGAALNPGRPLALRWQMLVVVGIVAAIVIGGIQAASTERVDKLDAGQCIDIPADESFADVTLVPCAEPHDAEVLGVIRKDSPLIGSVEDACVALAIERVDPTRAEGVDLASIEPDGSSSLATYRAVCLVEGADGKQLTGSVSNP